MKRYIYFKKKIKSFNNVVSVDSDKSLSIRWALLSSIARGKSKAYNLLQSEDVKNTLNALKKLGVKIKITKKYHEIIGNGLNSFVYKKNLILNAENSGTLGRLLMPLLIRSPYKIKIIGDNSLSKRDFWRIIKPMQKFGASFYPKNRKKLPLFIKGSNFIRAINYKELRGSAQCKTAVMLAALNATGKTIIKAKKSRNHSELLFKYLKIPIKIKSLKNYDQIEVEGKANFKSFNYKMPGDISSSAFFIVLTLLSKNSKLEIKKVNINPSRTGIITILNKMGAKIKFKNVKNYKGEKIANIQINSCRLLKSINCPSNLNSSAIDEFPIIFLAAAKARGISYFKDLSELNKKESPRLNICSKILNNIGIKTILTKDSIKIFGNPNLDLKGKYEVKNFYKDHRILMFSVIASLVLGGNWKIYEHKCANTSFPSFFKIIKKLINNET